MTSTRFLIGTISSIGLALAACGGTSSPAGSSAPSTASPATPALIHTMSLMVGDKTEPVLKNEGGLTLYYFKPDTATTVACTGGCAAVWPPLISTSETPTSDPALPGKLGVISGANGSQVTYNGHPLYNYSKDGGPGDALGQGLFGKWFVATPDLAAVAGTGASVSKYTPSY
jgi:predicted lipoprotein with Yx(FWY)xxD motif